MSMSAATTKTVLLVDDSELLLEMAAFHLEQSGFNVVTACDLASLRARLAGSAPDLVVLDVQMPDVSTDELLATLETTGAPIWLFSALDEAQLAQRAAAAGADGHVCKNQGLEELARRAKALFET
jgi:two-component system response regulator MprA